MEPFSDRPDRFPSLRRVFVPGPGRRGARGARSTSLLAAQGPLRAEARGRRLDRRGRGATAAWSCASARTSWKRCPRARTTTTSSRACRSRTRRAGRWARSTDILETGGEAPVLVVRGGRGGEMLIPLAEEFVRQVDLEHGRLVAVTPELVDAMMRIDVVTIFPRMLEAPAGGRDRAARAARPASSRIGVHDLRAFTDDRHRTRGRRAVRRRAGHGDEGGAVPARGGDAAAPAPGARARGRAALAARPALRPGRRPRASPASTGSCCCAAATRGSTSACARRWPRRR